MFLYIILYFICNKKENKAMVNMYEIIKAFEAGEKTLEQANVELKGTGIQLDPEKNVIKPEEAAVVCEDVSKINGFAMLDTGTGSLDKVEIKNGKLVYSVGDMVAFVVIGDALFEVMNGTDLVRKK